MRVPQQWRKICARFSANAGFADDFRASQRLRKALGTGTNRDLWGSPASELMAFAADHYVSLLVVGSAGHRTTPLIRLGANSERVAAESQIPTLVVTTVEGLNGQRRHGEPLQAPAPVATALLLKANVFGPASRHRTQERSR